MRSRIYRAKPNPKNPRHTMKDFTQTLDQLLQTLSAERLFGKLHRNNFTNSEFIQLQTQIAQIAMQGAIQLQELEMKRNQIGIENEKTRQELELATISSHLQNLKIASEAILVCTQAESVKRSTVDNARIQKANAFINHFNVSGSIVAANATNLSGGVLRNYSDVSLKEINAIDTSDMDSKYTQALDNILDKALTFREIAASKERVSIIAPKTTLRVGENITLMGISAFGDNEAYFIIHTLKDTPTEQTPQEPDEQEAQVEHSKIYTYTATQAGSQKITFKAQDNASKWIETSITLTILPPKEKKCH